MNTTCSIGVGSPSLCGSGKRAFVVGQSSFGPNIWARRLLAPLWVAPAAGSAAPVSDTIESEPTSGVASPGVPLYGAPPVPLPLAMTSLSPTPMTDVGYQPAGMLPSRAQLPVWITSTAL